MAVTNDTGWVYDYNAYGHIEGTHREVTYDDSYDYTLDNVLPATLPYFNMSSASVTTFDSLSVVSTGSYTTPGTPLHVYSNEGMPTPALPVCSSYTSFTVDSWFLPWYYTFDPPQYYNAPGKVKADCIAATVTKGSLVFYPTLANSVRGAWVTGAPAIILKFNVSGGFTFY